MPIELLYFILGILFVQFILPILEDISVPILGLIEIIKTKQVKILTQLKAETQEITDKTTKTKRVIGFGASENEEEDEENEI